MTTPDYILLAICINGPFLLYWVGRWFLNRSMPLKPEPVIDPTVTRLLVLAVVNDQFNRLAKTQSPPVSGAGPPDAGTGGETG